MATVGVDGGSQQADSLTAQGWLAWSEGWWPLDA